MRKNLKLLRVEHDLTQAQMAERLGVSSRCYGSIEKGRSNGELDFWLKLKAEFPAISIEEMAKKEGSTGSEEQTKNRA